MKKLFLYFILPIVILIILGSQACNWGLMFCSYGGGNSDETKSIHSQTLKYISVEILMCSLGESKFMGNQDCPPTAAKAITGAVATMTDKNPYYIKNNAVRISTSNTNDKDVGYINLSVSGSKVIVKTCHKKPCSENYNRQKHTTLEIK